MNLLDGCKNKPLINMDKTLAWTDITKDGLAYEQKHLEKEMQWKDDLPNILKQD